MTGNKKHLSLITVNVKGLNSPIKRYRLPMWTKEHNPTVCCLQETHLTGKDTHRLKVKGWKKIYHANGNQKQAGITMLISNTANFKLKLIRRNNAGNILLIKGTTQQEDVMIVNIHAPNVSS